MLYTLGRGPGGGECFWHTPVVTWVSIGPFEATPACPVGEARRVVDGALVAVCRSATLRHPRGGRDAGADSMRDHR